MVNRPIAPLQVAWDVMLAGYRVPTGWHQHPDRNAWARPCEIQTA